MAVDPGSRHYRTRLVIPIVAAEFAAAAPRPRYSALANLRAERRFGVRLSAWRDDMARMLATLEG
jgi:dTDP-4-dehydrorhamnose reductase